MRRGLLIDAITPSLRLAAWSLDDKAMGALDHLSSADQAGRMSYFVPDEQLHAKGKL
jgi:hypothetical protein